MRATVIPWGFGGKLPQPEGAGSREKSSLASVLPPRAGIRQAGPFERRRGPAAHRRAEPRIDARREGELS